MAATQERETLGSRNLARILFRWFLIKMEILSANPPEGADPQQHVERSQLHNDVPIPILGELDPDRPLNATELHQPLLVQVILVHLSELAALKIGHTVNVTLPPDHFAVQENGSWCTTPHRMYEYFAKVIRICMYDIHKQKIRHHADHQPHEDQHPFIPTDMGVIREADSATDEQIPDTIPKFLVEMITSSIVEVSRVDRSGHVRQYKIPTEFTVKRIE